MSFLSFLGKHKEGNSNKMNFEYLEECLNLLNEIKTRFEKYVENTEYKKVRDVKLVEPFISGKAFIFLNEILLEEKKAFRTEDEGGKCTQEITIFFFKWTIVFKGCFCLSYSILHLFFGNCLQILPYWSVRLVGNLIIQFLIDQIKNL